MYIYPITILSFFLILDFTSVSVYNELINLYDLPSVTINVPERFLEVNKMDWYRSVMGNIYSFRDNFRLNKPDGYTQYQVFFSLRESQLNTKYTEYKLTAPYVLELFCFGISTKSSILPLFDSSHSYPSKVKQFVELIEKMAKHQKIEICHETQGMLPNKEEVISEIKKQAATNPQEIEKYFFSISVPV